MASFKIHDDQENKGYTSKSMAGAAAAAFGQQKRTVMGALDNVPTATRALGAKQPFEQRNHKDNVENVFRKQVSKAPAPPLAQFQAFNVKEDSNETQKENVQEVPKHVEKFFQQMLKLADAKDSKSGKDAVPPPLQPVPEESKPKTTSDTEVTPTSPQCNRNKDLFFELEEYRDSIYSYLLEHEKKNRAKPNYMRRQPDITHNMRTILVDWLVEVAEEYKLHTETLFLAVNYIDRFLSFMSVVKGKLQLVGTAAMFLASKYEEIYPPDVNEFVYITDDTYSKKQVFRMEILILKVLDFDLSLPTAYTFITAMSISNKLPENVTFLAQYLSELALLEAEPMLEILPSVMAASSIAVARHTLQNDAWSPELVHTTSYTLQQLRTGIEFLQTMYRKAESLPQQAVQEKYKSAKYLHVSTITPARLDIQFF